MIDTKGLIVLSLLYPKTIALTLTLNHSLQEIITPPNHYNWPGSHKLNFVNPDNIEKSDGFCFIDL
jgi:hypothetical protein